ncbi:hypothetical protein D3C71_1641110 [compost metagenome]
MLSLTKKTQISLACHAIVGDKMSMLLNPKYRGPNFSWDKFPDMMARQCRIYLPINVVMSQHMIEQCLDYAEQEGRDIAQTWVKNMTE